MASVYKRGRWVDGQGRKCGKDAPGAKWAESRFYTVAYAVNGRIRRTKGYTDRQASEQLASKLERAKAQGAEGLDDPYKPHRNRRLAEHVGDWIAELRQLGRDHVYVGLCESRMARMIEECHWETLAGINPERLIRWRETATVTVGKAKKKGSNVKSMGAATQNHYLDTVRAFCLWAVKRKRMAGNPMADVRGVETAGQLRRQRRALTEDETAALLGAVPERHQLAYRTILATGLRRDELKQLRWGDVKLNAPMPCIELRPETTKAKRADVLPLRQDLAELLRAARGEAGDAERVYRTMPSMDSHKRYLAKAGIAYEDEQGRRADLHSLRHTYGTMLAKAGIAPRVAMSLMRHTDMRLTMNVYTDPRVFDMAGAVEKLPAMVAMHVPALQATGTDGNSLPAGWCESGTSPSAQIGHCSASIGKPGAAGVSTLTLAGGGNRQQKTPSGRDGVKERVKGVEPSTFTLAT
jgi:integrase